MSEVGARRSRENTRQRLFDAAVEVFAEVGFDAASVEAISERAGFTRGAFYSNFESKNELVLALTAEFVGAKLDRVGERLREMEPGSFDVEAILERIVDATAESRADTALLTEIRARALRDEALGAAYLEWQEEMYVRVAALIDDVLRASGTTLRLPSIDVARLFIAAWTATETEAAIARLDDDTCRARVVAVTARIAGLLTD